MISCMLTIFFWILCFNQAKKFLKRLDVDAHVIDQIALWFT